MAAGLLQVVNIEWQEAQMEQAGLLKKHSVRGGLRDPRSGLPGWESHPAPVVGPERELPEQGEPELVLALAQRVLRAQPI